MPYLLPIISTTDNHETITAEIDSVSNRIYKQTNKPCAPWDISITHIESYGEDGTLMARIESRTVENDRINRAVTTGKFSFERHDDQLILYVITTEKYKMTFTTADLHTQEIVFKRIYEGTIDENKVPLRGTLTTESKAEKEMFTGLFYNGLFSKGIYTLRHATTDVLLMRIHFSDLIDSNNRIHSGMVQGQNSTYTGSFCYISESRTAQYIQGELSTPPKYKFIGTFNNNVLSGTNCTLICFDENKQESVRMEGIFVNGCFQKGLRCDKVSGGGKLYSVVTLSSSNTFVPDPQHYVECMIDLNEQTIMGPGVHLGTVDKPIKVHFHLSDTQELSLSKDGKFYLKHKKNGEYQWLKKMTTQWIPSPLPPNSQVINTLQISAVEIFLSRIGLIPKASIDLSAEYIQVHSTFSEEKIHEHTRYLNYLADLLITAQCEETSSILEGRYSLFTEKVNQLFMKLESEKKDIYEQSSKRCLKDIKLSKKLQSLISEEETGRKNIESQSGLSHFEIPFALEAIESQLKTIFNTIMDRFVPHRYECYVVGSAVANLLLKKPLDHHQDIDLIVRLQEGETINLAPLSPSVYIPGLHTGEVTIDNRVFKVDILVINSPLSGSAFLKEDIRKRDVQMRSVYYARDGQLHDPTKGGISGIISKRIVLNDIDLLTYLLEHPISVLRIMKLIIDGNQPSPALSKALRNLVFPENLAVQPFIRYLNRLRAFFTPDMWRCYVYELKKYNLITSLFKLTFKDHDENENIAQFNRYLATHAYYNMGSFFKPPEKLAPLNTQSQQPSVANRG